MLLEKQEIIKRETLVGESEGFDMSLSSEDMAWLMSMLGDLYKDPYGIIPQELLSNGWDSHMAAGVDKPIVMSIKKDSSDKWYVAFQDFGEGLSPERIRIFGAFGKSTKRQDATAMGMYGIGCKSFMSYTKHLYIDTVHNGIKYKYYISPNKEGIPHIELLYSDTTDLPNQSKLWFYLKSDTSYYRTERTKFVDGAKRKTLYFENLVYDFDESLENLNQYKRIEGKTFVYNESNSFDTMHMLIGQIPYEIDFNIVSIPRIRIPVAIKVKGVYPSPTREAIKYSQQAIDNIKMAIEDTATELVTLYNKTVVNVTDWKEWLRLRTQSPFVKLGTHTVNIDELIKYSRVPKDNIIFKPLEGLDTTHFNAGNIFPFYCNNVIKSGRKTYNTGRNEYAHLHDKGKCLSLKGQLQGKKNTYLYNEVTRDDIYIVQRKKYKLKDYVSLLNLKKDDKANWRKKIVQYQNFVNTAWDEMESYDDIVVPKKYSTKVTNRKVSNKPDSAVTIYELKKRQNYDSNYVTTVATSHKKEFKNRGLVIYGEKEDRTELDKIWRIFTNQNVNIIYLAPSNFKYIKDKHQYVHMKDWHKTKAFSRAITAYKIQLLIKDYERLTRDCAKTYYNDTSYSWLLKGLSKEFAELLDELKAYSEKHCSNNVNKEFMKSLMIVADSEKLWDYAVYYKIDKLESYLKRFEFIKYFREESYTFKEVQKMAAQYIKKVTKDVRLDLKWYQHA